MGTPEQAREPCPDRILDDLGGAFGMGAVGGSVFHFIKGIYNSPKGSRIFGGVQAVSMNAPRVGGGFAVWGGLFSTIDCTMAYLRQKEDPWNSITSGAATGGILSMRQGFGAASRSAIFGGVFLALIEGGTIMMGKMTPQPMMIEEPVPGMPGGMPGMQMGNIPNQAQMMSENQTQNSDSSSSWFGGLFGKKNKEVKQGSESKTEVLESFDAPPVPSFEYK